MLLKAEKTFKISPSSNKSTIQYLKTKQFHVYVFFKCVLALGLQKLFVSIITRANGFEDPKFFTSFLW